MAENWEEIWNKKKTLNFGLEPEETSLIFKELIKANGFDTAVGKITLSSWFKYLKDLGKLLKVKQNDTIYEIGCGSGALLYYFYLKGNQVAGIDYSSSLIETSSRLMKDMNFLVGEASKVKIDPLYDIVISNSVFFYFPDYNYAKYVLNAMLSKSKRVIGIFDIPNLKYKKQSEAKRASLIENYKMNYKNLPHLYYPKKWFLDIAEEYGYDITIVDQNIKNYINNEYRYNVVITKNKF